jgi:hypothetical protein
VVAAIACGFAWRAWRSAALAGEVDALRRERQALQERFQALAEGPRDLGFGDAPAAGLLIGVPTAFTRDLAQQIVAGFFGELSLRLKDLSVHKADDVQARVLFADRTVGEFVLDLVIPEVTGTLRPGQPQVTFSQNRLGLSLDVTLVEGKGTARARLQWQSRGMASAVCGDIDVTRDLEGTLAPKRYRIEGAFAVAAENGAIVLRPRFKDVVVNVVVRPSEQAWQSLDEIVLAQGGLCRAALRKVDVRKRLGEIVERGFPVKLPASLFREIRLPAGVRQSLELQGLELTIRVQPAGVVVTPSRLWYGANVTTERR